MLPRVSLFLLVASLADATLWGWPGEFTISSYGRLIAYPPGDYGETYYTCNGWHNWCDLSQCEEMEHFKWSGRFPTGYVYAQKPNAAWMDLWRLEGTNTYNIFEKNGDGTVHGQCQVDSMQPETCEYNGFTSDKAMPYLHCWQY